MEMEKTMIIMGQVLMTVIESNFSPFNQKYRTHNMEYFIFLT